MSLGGSDLLVIVDAENRLKRVSKISCDKCNRSGKYSFIHRFLIV